MMNSKSNPIQESIYEAFGSDYDRFNFPGNIVRVTAGHGGEALLIKGSEKTALIDCGMAYCGDRTVENIKKVTDRLDYIMLSHSHYDHIGALSEIKEVFPGAEVLGNEKCAGILEKKSARELIVSLGETARNLYEPESRKEIRADNIGVDRILHDKESISLGNETVICYETRGHTDCSVSYMLEPAGLLFASESTGILEGINYVHTPCLKSFADSLESLNKCRMLSPDYICLPHFGMIPENFNEEYFRMFEEECSNKFNLVRRMLKEGLSDEEMLNEYVNEYWDPVKEKEQPFEAFELNCRHILKALRKYVEENDNV